MTCARRATPMPRVHPTPPPPPKGSTPLSKASTIRDVPTWRADLPAGDLDTARRALGYLRAMGNDLRYAAGRFYVLDHDGLWHVDDESAGRVAGLLQEWARFESD